MSEDIFGYHNGEDVAVRIWWVEVSDAVKISAMHRTASLLQQRIMWPKCNSAKVKNSAHSILGISCPVSAYSIFMLNLNLIYRK